MTLQGWQQVAARMYSELQPLDVLTIKSQRQVGKSTFIQQCLLYTALNRPKSIQIVVSPVASQNAKFFKELNNIVSQSPYIKNVSMVQMEIIFTNGSIIKMKSAEAAGLRGDHCHILYVDEAAFVSPDIFDVILPYLNTTRGNLVLTSTPQMKSGRFYDYYRKGIEGMPHHFSVDVSRFDNSYFLTNEQKEQYRESMPSTAFRTEILGEFLNDDEGVFGDYLSCIGEATNKLPYYIGIDWATTGTDSTVMTVMNQYGEVIDIYEYSGMNANDIIFQVSEYINSHKTIRRVLVEKNSIGSVYYDVIKGKLNNQSLLEAFVTTNKSKRDIVEHLSMLFSKKQIRIPNNPKLLNQLSNFVVKMTGNGKDITYENSNPNIHDDFVISLCLASWNINTSRGRYSISIV